MPMIPLNHHYSMENPASIYDEEAMTALELAGRTTAKVNEAVQAFNELETQTHTQLEEQDESIRVMNETTMPKKVKEEVQKNIDNGTFNRAINEYAGDLEARVNNLLGQVVPGSTTMDAEVIDSRTVDNGTAFVNLGSATRSGMQGVNSIFDASGIGGEVVLTLNAGAYITPNNSIVAHENQKWCYSEPVAVPAGYRVILYGYGYENQMAMISRSSGGTIECLVRSTGSGLKHYEFTTEKEENLVFSLNTANGYRLHMAKIGVGEASGKADLLQKAMADHGKWYTPELTINAGSYLNRNNTILAHKDYGMTEPIEVGAGYTVVLDGYGYQNQVAMIARVNPDGSYKCLVPSRKTADGGSQYARYYYTTNRTEKLMFSFSVVESNRHQISIVHTGMTMPASDMVSLSVFRRFGVVGDSYASGELYYGDTLHDKYENSWGQIMARKHGTECVNFSSGGLTTRSWLTNSKGLNLMKNSDPCDIYYLALGINDSNNLGADYLGTVADINTHADTFYGNYAKIIAEIKSHAPHAKIVLFTVREKSEIRTAYNEAIKNIAVTLGVPYIVQDSDEFFTSSFYLDTMDQGHPIAVTYSGMAEAYGRLIRECVVANVGYFANLYEY